LPVGDQPEAGFARRNTPTLINFWPDKRPTGLEWATEKEIFFGAAYLVFHNLLWLLKTNTFLSKQMTRPTFGFFEKK
jgi:hypothetical protein